jgi:hypothetical protein
LLDLFAHVPLYYAHDFATPCSSYSTLLLYFSCFKLVPPPLSLFFFTSVECGGAIQIQVLETKLGRWEFCVQFLFVEFF